MRQVRQARFITNNMHSPPQVTLLTVNTAEQTVRRLHSRVRNWGKLNVLVTRALEWSGMVGPGLALGSSISLENSDGGQWENILLVFSLARRHLLSGLPVLLCSWAWTLRVVDVLCCGAGVWLRMWEVILLKNIRQTITWHLGSVILYMSFSTGIKKNMQFAYAIPGLNTCCWYFVPGEWGYRVVSSGGEGSCSSSPSCSSGSWNNHHYTS